MTVSPVALSTGRLSPVSMLSSTAVAPSVTTPSTGTFSPGRTRTRSPTTTCSTGTSTSAPLAQHPGGLRGQADEGGDRGGGPLLRLRLHPPAGQDEREDHQRGLEVHVQRQPPPLGGGRPEGDEGAVARRRRRCPARPACSCSSSGAGRRPRRRGRCRAPAQNCTTVATTRIAGISQSIVSRYSGTYISTIRPRPAASVICHLRLSVASCASSSRSVVRRHPGLRPARRAGSRGVGWRCSRPRVTAAVSSSRPICGGVEADGGDLGGEVDLGGGDAVDPVQRLLHRGRRRRRRSCRRCRGCSWRSSGEPWSGPWWSSELLGDGVLRLRPIVRGGRRGRTGDLAGFRARNGTATGGCRPGDRGVRRRDAGGNVATGGTAGGSG